MNYEEQTRLLKDLQRRVTKLEALQGKQETLPHLEFTCVDCERYEKKTGTCKWSNTPISSNTPACSRFIMKKCNECKKCGGNGYFIGRVDETEPPCEDCNGTGKEAEQPQAGGLAERMNTFFQDNRNNYGWPAMAHQLTKELNLFSLDDPIESLPLAFRARVALELRNDWYVNEPKLDFVEWLNQRIIKESEAQDD